MQEPDILSVLKDAQTAFRAGDFANSLKFYEHFFDHALDDDPYALYAVRLSHCLDGWTELAHEFPGAKKALERKKNEMLDAYFEKGRDPERFHDFFALCRALGRESEALEEFLKLHNHEPKSAAKLSKYVWNDLLHNEHWQICSELMVESNQKLDELLAVFDEAAKLKEFDSSFDNPKFEQHIVDNLLNDLQNIVMVLRHADRHDDRKALERQFHQAVDQRNHPLLSKQVHAKSSFLFSGH